MTSMNDGKNDEWNNADTREVMDKFNRGKVESGRSLGAVHLVMAHISIQSSG